MNILPANAVGDKEYLGELQGCWDNRKVTIGGDYNNADNSSTVFVFSSAVQGIEIPDPEPDIMEQDEPVEKNKSAVEDIVNDTPLTQEEIDELKTNATTDIAKEGIETYESIINTGSWIVPNTGDTTVTKAESKPGDIF